MAKNKAKYERSTPVVSAEDAATRPKKVKNIAHVIGVIETPKEKPDSEKVLIMICNVAYNGKEYPCGSAVPADVAKFFIKEGFAEYK